MIKQLIIYFALAYAFSWLIWWPMYAPALGFQSYAPFKYQHALGAFGPLIAGLITGCGFRGVKWLGRLRFSLHAHSLIYLLIALLSPFLLTFLACAILYFQTGIFPDLGKIGLSREFPEGNIISFFFYNLIFFGFGEEVGWRGFALPVLQSRYNALAASVILTAFWALWHLPLFLYRPGYTSMDIAGVIGWVVSLLTGSVLLTWLFNSSNGSILVCAIFHSAIDVAFTSDYLDSKLVGLTGMLITVWGIITVAVFKPRNLALKSRVMSFRRYNSR